MHLGMKKLLRSFIAIRKSHYYEKINKADYHDKDNKIKLINFIHISCKVFIMLYDCATCIRSAMNFNFDSLNTNLYKMAPQSGIVNSVLHV